jgi:biotin operon repressor
MNSTAATPAFCTPPGWALTRGERAVFGALLSEDAVSAARVASTASVTVRSVGVLMSRLRKKIAPHGVEIETVSGKGWRLNGRETWRTALAALTPAPGAQ